MSSYEPKAGKPAQAGERSCKDPSAPARTHRPGRWATWLAVSCVAHSQPTFPRQYDAAGLLRSSRKNPKNCRQAQPSRNAHTRLHPWPNCEPDPSPPLCTRHGWNSFPKRSFSLCFPPFKKKPCCAHFFAQCVRRHATAGQECWLLPPSEPWLGRCWELPLAMADACDGTEPPLAEVLADARHAFPVTDSRLPARP